MFGWEGGRSSARGRNAGSPSLLKGRNPVWRCRSPSPGKGGQDASGRAEGETVFSPRPAAGMAPSYGRRGGLFSPVEEGGCGGRHLGSRERRLSARGRNAGSPSLLKGRNPAWRCPLPFPWKGGAGCLWTCRGETVFSPRPAAGMAPSYGRRCGLFSPVEEGAAGADIWAAGRGDPLHAGGMQGVLSSKRAQSGLAVPLPFPRKGGAGCLWTCRRETVFSPYPAAGMAPSYGRRGGCPLLWRRLRGGCLGGKRDRFSSYLGRSPLKGATRFGDTIPAFSKGGTERPPVRRGTGGLLPAGGSGTSGFGGATPLPPEKEGERPHPPGGGAISPDTRPGGGRPSPRGGRLLPPNGQWHHRLFNGGRSVPAPGAAGDGKNRSANHRPGGAVPAVRPCATPSRTPFSAYPSPFSPPVQLCHR